MYDETERVWSDDSADAVIPKKGWKLPLLAAVASATALGASYYAYDQKTAHDTGTAALVRADDDNKVLSRALKRHQSRAAKLDSKLSVCKIGLDEEKSASAEQGAKLASCQGSVDAFQEQTADAEKRLAEFNRLTAEFRKMIDSGKLDIAFRRGRMVVKLSAAVLFGSGQAELSKRGQTTLTELAKVLSKMRARRFIVAGHTDTVSVSKDSAFHSNWALSTARAVTVTEALITAGVRPKTLMAAGLGPNEPLSTNSTKRGRQRNRRIEIILEPNMAPAAKIDRIASKKRKSKRRRKRAR